MKKQVLMISRGISFMVTAVEKNIQSSGYEVVRAEPTVKSLDEHQKDSDIFVFYVGDFVGEISEALVYLRDLCTEGDKQLILIGNPADLSVVEDYIPPALVVAKFERPFDIKRLTDEIDRLMLVNDDNARKKSILLVDDDGTFLKMVKGWLSDEYRVTIVSSGTQALMYIADNIPDLILLDYEMPVTSGAQVLEMIRSEKKVASVPIIFLTGKGDRESVMKVLDLKPDGYLLKSMNRDALLRAVAEFFEKKKYQAIHEGRK